ncbi:hypothetical protein C2E23DRAFT_907701 [Lenzites betulinus]|nr:hypothetical protein C2E23DRAFT_907701 [Lenzites betulinus]
MPPRARPKARTSGRILRQLEDPACPSQTVAEPTDTGSDTNIGVTAMLAQSDMDVADVHHPDDEASSKDDAERALITTHGYGTRARNRTSHPGLEAGLAKRTREEIHAQAASKKAAQAEKNDALDAHRASQDKSRDLVALLEDRRMAQDADEDLYFATAPNLGNASLDSTPLMHSTDR